MYKRQPKDELVVTRIDRLARSVYDLENLVHLLKKKDVTLKATEQPIDLALHHAHPTYYELGQL